MKRAAIVACAVTLISPAAFAQTLSCPVSDGVSPTKAKRDFVEAYASANYATQKQDWLSAISLADSALPHAIDARQAQAALAVRMVALEAIRDDARLADTLERRITLGCMTGADAASLPAMLDATRSRLAAPQQ